MKKLYPESLLEVWKWKEAVYNDTINIKDKCSYFRDKCELFAKDLGLTRIGKNEASNKKIKGN